MWPHHVLVSVEIVWTEMLTTRVDALVLQSLTVPLACTIALFPGAAQVFVVCSAWSCSVLRYWVPYVATLALQVWKASHAHPSTFKVKSCALSSRQIELAGNLHARNLEHVRTYVHMYVMRIDPWLRAVHCLIVVNSWFELHSLRTELQTTTYIFSYPVYQNKCEL